MRKFNVETEFRLRSCRWASHRSLTVAALLFAASARCDQSRDRKGAARIAAGFDPEVTTSFSSFAYAECARVPGTIWFVRASDRSLTVAALLFAASAPCDQSRDRKGAAHVVAKHLPEKEKEKSLADTAVRPLSKTLSRKPKGGTLGGMSVLPIVERELRVATRRRATYWNRSISLVVATIIILYLLPTLGRLAGPARAGAEIFSTLTRLAFLGCLFSGVFLTADCLSEEKREGTLGLLFLTDLKGYDVVLGKLMATSLNAFYGLLAIFPVLAVPLLMGGVSFGEFFRVTLALVNTLIFSLALGMFISSVSWKEQKAMLGAAGLLVVIGIIFAALPGPFEWVSPRLAFRLAANGPFQLRPQLFAWALLTVQGLSWGLLFLACRTARSSWQAEKPRRGLKEEDSRLQVGNPGSEPQVTHRPEESQFSSTLELGRRELLDKNPMEWLASRNRSNGWVWCSLGVLALAWFMVCLNETATSLGSFVESFSLVVSLHALLKFWIAWEASRRFYDHRRDGTLESLLSTPLSLTDVIQGQFKSLFNQFVRPIAVVLMFDLFLMSWLASSPFLGAVSSGANWSLSVMLVMMGLLVADAFALGWLGLWLGLQAKKSWTTAFGALARIILLPACISLVTLGFVGPKGPAALIVIWGFVGGINSLAFGLGAYQKLHTHFRAVATQGAVSGPIAAPPPPPETPELEEYFSLFKE